MSAFISNSFFIQQCSNSPCHSNSILISRKRLHSGSTTQSHCVLPVTTLFAIHNHSILESHGVLLSEIDPIRVQNAFSNIGLHNFYSTTLPRYSNIKLHHLSGLDDDIIVSIPDFLSEYECDTFITHSNQLISDKDSDSESDLYLNYRVNREVEAGVSQEALDLIQEQGLTELELAANAPSGFRTHLHYSVIGDAIIHRVLELLGFAHRKADFEEGIWVKPDPRTVIFRDQTVVYYQQGEGVAPHVDGKDATVLIYLNDLDTDNDASGKSAGGCTVFPEIGVSVAPRKGTAVLYQSKKSLLHYSERLGKGEKWILQMLIDYQYSQAHAPFVDRTTGEIFFE